MRKTGARGAHPRRADASPVAHLSRALEKNLLTTRSASSNGANLRVHGRLLVYSGVKAPHHARHGHFEYPADAQQSGHGDGAAHLDLRPMAGRESVEKHVVLRVASFPRRSPYFRTERLEEFFLLHAPVCSLLGAEADREARRTEKEKNKSRVKALIITATVIACVAALLLMFHR